MKKLGIAVSILFLLCVIPALSAQDKQDVKILKEKVEQKVAQMKAAGASDEEIKAFLLEAKKKIEQVNANSGAMSEEAFKAKVDQKAAEMRAAGASDDEIKKMATEAKQKWAQMNANNGGNGGAMDEQAFKAKVEEKAAQMKANGASNEEIKKFVTEAKQKWDQQNANNGGGVMDEKAFKEKLEQKAAQMKANGASNEEIKKFVTEAKQKWNEQNTKTKRD
jgi:DNA-binding transcriptional regulator YhcF (GntR family)